MPQKSSLELDLYINASREIHLHEPINGLRRQVLDINQSLVSPNFKLLAGILVNVRGAEHSVNTSPAERKNNVGR